MNMKELVKEVFVQYRGYPPLTKTQITEVLYCALYVIIQELIIRKGFGEIDIHGFGRLYLNRRMYQTTWTDEKYGFYWTPRFTPSLRLRNLLNDKITYEEYITIFHSMTDEAIAIYNMKLSGRKYKTYRKLEINTDIKEMCMKYHITQAELANYLHIAQSGICRNLNRKELSKKLRKEYISAIKYLASQKRRMDGEQE